MKELFEVLTTPVNKMRITMVFSYLFAFMLYAMTIMDFVFELSPTVFTLSIDAGFMQAQTFEAGYWLCYAVWGGLFWKLMNWSSQRVDVIELEQRSMSKIIILD